MTAADRPPVGTPVSVIGRCGDESMARTTLTGTVTRWVGRYTLEVTGAGWSGLYAPEGVVVVEMPR